MKWEKYAYKYIEIYYIDVKVHAHKRTLLKLISWWSTKHQKG